MLKRWIYKLSALLNIVGVSMTLLMVVLIVTDVLGRLLFNLPLQGAYELVEYMMGLAIALAIGYTQVQGAHINIPTLVEMLPGMPRRLMERFINLVAFVMFGLITWQNFIKAGMEVRTGTTSSVLYIPTYPFRYACTLGFAILTLIFLMQILLPDDGGQNTEEKQDLIV
jgi:TRAP-type C4-dicarboxylate transport system permease small subunit